MADHNLSDLTEVPTPEKEGILTFEIGDYGFMWKLDGLALDRAAEQGVELGDVLGALGTVQQSTQEIARLEDEEVSPEDLDEENLQTSLASLTKAVARLVWIGGLRFEENLSFKAVLSVLGPKHLESVPVEAMVKRALPEVGEEEEVGKEAQKEAGKEAEEA